MQIFTKRKYWEGRCKNVSLNIKSGNQKNMIFRSEDVKKVSNFARSKSNYIKILKHGFRRCEKILKHLKAARFA